MRKDCSQGMRVQVSCGVEMSNRNPHKQTLARYKNKLGQYKFERLCSVIKVLESKGIPYQVSKLARCSRKELLRIKNNAMTQVKDARAKYRAKQEISEGQPIPLKTATEFIEQ
jgi:hypothetical protein